METLTFLHPALLWGLGLASIPIIIHLLFRRRFRRIEWAPMRYLKLTIQRNRRRVQLEQLLLLLLRTALILLLFFLVARPLLHLPGLGEWLGASSRASKVLVLDDSLSMSSVQGDHSAFQRAVELATQIIRDLRPQDRFTLVLTSQPKRPLLREVEHMDEGQLTQLLQQLKPTDTFLSWAPALAAIDELVSSSTYPLRDVTILTDLRRAGWEKEVKDLADRWDAAQIHVRIFDVGSTKSRQVTIESLEADDSFALVGVPARWQAVVRNLSDQPLDHLEATVLIDGKPNQLTLPPLPVGQPVQVPITATFQEPGMHHLSLRLPTDDLPGGNQRWSVVEVRDRLHLVLVDGEPSAEPLGGEVDFLALALSSGPGESSAFHIEMLTDSDIASIGRIQPDLLVLANLTSLTPQIAQRLRSLVESGMGLMIFVGDQIDADNLNQVLSRDGVELLPAQLESIADEPVTGMMLEANSPSALDSLRQLKPAVLERIKMNKYYRMRLPAGETTGVRVLARWNDADSSPAVIEKLVGRGRVLLWTTTADKAWSDWPIQPSFVLAIRESVKAVSRGGGPRDIVAGETLRRAVPADVQIQSPTIETPQTDKPQTLALESGSLSDARQSGDDSKPSPDSNPPPKETNPDATRFLSYSDTRWAGLYQLHWQADPGGPGSDLFAVNADTRESDLTPITTGELLALWGNLRPEIISAGSTSSQIVTRGEEIWRPLAMCLLGLMLVEACFATWTGRQR